MRRRILSGRGSAGPARIMTAAVSALLVLLSAVMLAACSGSGAEAEVKAGLDQLKASETAAAKLEAVQETLPEEAGADFEAFLAKVRDFDYVIIGSETVSEAGDEYTAVDVKITSYDFGREYIAAWTDYLKNHKNASSEDAEGREFYKVLFARLAGLEDKDRISFAEIRATESADGGWTTDIQTNEELQDALFGGMISEMKALAEE